ncbi:MAG TPA: tyrosine--tRNA ligase [Planctomycetota bacterium]|nr:tyrosine--tRNA ligase [Planctomycetota bacterium]
MSSFFLDELEQRGLVADVVKKDELRALAARETVTGYIGFDPTADSLHVGSLIQVLALVRMQRSGHKPIALVGGGTGLIGDPSGKQAERTLQTKETVEGNAAAIKKQLERWLDFAPGKTGALMENNVSWLGSVPLLDFLRDIGKHFSVNEMVKRDSVRMRLEERDQGISFTEFSYMLLQAYDFLVLHEKHGCKLQIGGSDQFGNIVSGVELIRRIRGDTAFGITQHLVTNASGTKFGKTEAGTVWLSPARTSPYKLYQFWLRTEDKDVAKFLKWFTFLPLEEIETLAKSPPEMRQGHAALAREVTRFVHGDAAIAQAEKATNVLFGKGDLRELGAAVLLDVFDEVPAREIPRARFEGEGIKLLDLVVEAGLCKSRGLAKTDVDAGAIYVNGAGKKGQKDLPVTTKDLIDGQVLVLRRGKANNLVVKAV